MARRSARTHAAFLLGHLRESMKLLDCGCGPGSITCDLARLLPAGHVTGIDREATQVDRAREHAANQGITNVDFKVAPIYELPFPDGSFDVVFAHAVFEHLSTPERALAEVHRVLRPGGLAALRSPDWGGFIVAPETAEVQSALKRYIELQIANGGDVHAGRKLPALLRLGGFTSLCFSASYECYESAPLIAEYLAARLAAAKANSEAAALMEWSKHPDAVFAQAWCEIVGRRS